MRCGKHCMSMKIRKKNNSWIPVDKELPEDGTKCLVTQKFGRVRHVSKATYACDLYKVNQYDFVIRKTRRVSIILTMNMDMLRHWMLLPGYRSRNHGRGDYENNRDYRGSDVDNTYRNSGVVYTDIYHL